MRAAWVVSILLPMLFSTADCGALDADFGPIGDRLNADRRDAGLPELKPARALEDVAREVARQVTNAGAVDGVEVTSEALSHRLRERGYEHRLLVLAYVIGAEEERLVDEWPAADPTTWERFMDPALRDVAMARGDTTDGPFHLLLAAVSQNDAKAEESAGLADRQAVRSRILELTNELRRDEDMVQLVADAGLDQVAQAYADDMLRRGFYGHESPEGRSAMDRIRAGRIAVRRAGENLAEGPPTADSVVKSWFDSPNHRRNLLHKGFRRMGVGVAAGEGPDGVYKILWVQLFTSNRRPVL